MAYNLIWIHSYKYERPCMDMINCSSPLLNYHRTWRMTAWSPVAKVKEKGPYMRETVVRLPLNFHARIQTVSSWQGEGWDSSSYNVFFSPEFLRKHIVLRFSRCSELVCLRKHIALRCFRWSKPVFLRKHKRCDFQVVQTIVSKKTYSVEIFQVVRTSVPKRAYSVDIFLVVRTSVLEGAINDEIFQVVQTSVS